MLIQIPISVFNLPIILPVLSLSVRGFRLAFMLAWQALGLDRLFHSLLAQHQWQAICLPLGLCRGLSVASENGGNSHWSHEPIMHCSLCRMHWVCWYHQSILSMQPIRQPYLIPYWKSCRLGLCNCLVPYSQGEQQTALKYTMVINQSYWGIRFTKLIQRSFLFI